MNEFVSFLITLLIFVGCNSQKVTVDYDRNVNFNQVKTFRINNTVTTGLNDLDQARLFEALEKNFKYRGVLKSENSDVEVSVKPREYVSTNAGPSVGLGVGTGIFNRIGGGISVGVPVRTKSLNQEYTVSMYQNNTMIWEGILNLKMPVNASAQVKQQNMDKGVAKLLANYPPKK